mgnify:CR=1 FL=1
MRPLASLLKAVQRHVRRLLEHDITWILSKHLGRSRRIENIVSDLERESDRPSVLQQTLAHRLGCTRRHRAHLERDREECPRLHVMERVQLSSPESLPLPEEVDPTVTASPGSVDPTAEEVSIFLRERMSSPEYQRNVAHANSEDAAEQAEMLVVDDHPPPRTERRVGKRLRVRSLGSARALAVPEQLKPSLLPHGLGRSVSQSNL